MTLELYLEPYRKDLEPGGVLIWNEGTGEVSGYRAELIRKAAAHARKAGYVSYTPLGLHSEADPLRDRKAMSILLAELCYKNPEPLRGLFEVEDIIPGVEY